MLGDTAGPSFWYPQDVQIEHSQLTSLATLNSCKAGSVQLHLDAQCWDEEDARESLEAQE